MGHLKKTHQIPKRQGTHKTNLFLIKSSWRSYSGNLNLIILRVPCKPNN